MIRLTTLGPPGLSGSATSALDNVMSQPKRALLLAYLATARPRGFQRREILLALLWPEFDEVRGRQALRQSLYMLRRAIGREAIANRGEAELGLNWDAVSVDAREFEDELAAGHLEKALGLYGGDFLSGLHVPDGSAELDEWIEEERRRFRTMAASAAWSLANRFEKEGNLVQAAHWAHRAASLAPTDEGSARQLIALLARSGDRSGAIRAYEEYFRRLRALELEPSQRIRDLAREIQAGPEATTPPPAIAAVAAPLTVPAAAESPRLVSGQVARRSWPVWALGPLVIAAIVLLVLRARAPSATDQVFAVGEFRDVTRPDSALPLPILTDLLATSLARVPGLQVLSGARLLELRSQLGAGRGDSVGALAAARAGGASVLAAGTVVAGAGTRTLSLQLMDIGNGRITASMEVQGRDLFEVVDRATAALAERLGAKAPDQSVTEVTTRSLVGYRFYEEGLRAYFQGDYSAARRLFETALTEDSAFAMAAYYGAMATLGEPHTTMLERANRLADRTTERERLLIRATWLAERQDPAAVATAESLVVRYPTDPNGYRIHGTLEQARGDYGAAVTELRRAITIDSMSLTGRSLNCAACEAYNTLAVTYQYWDSLGAAEAVAREWITKRPDDGPAWLSWMTSLDWQNDPRTLEVLRQARARFGRDFEAGMEPALFAIRLGRHEEADQRLGTIRQEGDTGARADASWYLAISLRDQGRLAEAAAIRPMDAGMGAIVDFERGRFVEAGSVFAAHAALSGPLTPGHVARNRAWNLTHLATTIYQSGDTARLTSLADSVEEAGRLSLFGRDERLPHYIRGLLARARGDLPEAEREFRAAVYSWNAGYTRINLELGRTLLELNRPREAVLALRPALRGSIESSNLYVTRTELHELLAQAFAAAGETDSARVHYRWVEEAWRHADPSFKIRYEAAHLFLTHGARQASASKS